MADKKVIGLTGNIATGKSIVLRMLQELGATVIDADKLVHQLMKHGEPVYQAIVEEFGKYVLDGTGQINRKKLGQIVFADPEGLAKLERISHPAVRQVHGDERDVDVADLAHLRRTLGHSGQI